MYLKVMQILISIFISDKMQLARYKLLERTLIFQSVVPVA